MKQESETWSSVKMTAKLRHSGRAQSPLSGSFSSISIRVAVAVSAHCASAPARSLHGMGDCAHHQYVVISVH